MQIFGNNRCLLISGDHAGNFKVFLDDVAHLDAALNRQPKSTFNHTKLGPNVVFAVDETQGLLVTVSSESGSVGGLLFVLEVSSPMTPCYRILVDCMSFTSWRIFRR